MDRGPWWATYVPGVAKSQRQLEQLTQTLHLWIQPTIVHVVT